MLAVNITLTQLSSFIMIQTREHYLQNMVVVVPATTTQHFTQSFKQQMSHKNILTLISDNSTLAFYETIIQITAIN